jgi:hypothetical protein
MVLIRYLVYFASFSVLIWLLTQLEIMAPGTLKLHVYTSSSDTLGTSEYSAVEMIQVVVLLGCGALYAWVAYHCPSQRPIALPFGGLAAIFAIRELDYFLDKYVVDNFWQAVMAVIAAVLIAYTYWHRRRVRIAFLRIWPSPGLTLLYAGAIILFVFVRLSHGLADAQPVRGGAQVCLHRPVAGHDEADIRDAVADTRDDVEQAVHAFPRCQTTRRQNDRPTMRRFDRNPRFCVEIDRVVNDANPVSRDAPSFDETGKVPTRHDDALGRSHVRCLQSLEGPNPAAVSTRLKFVDAVGREPMAPRVLPREIADDFHHDRRPPNPRGEQCRQAIVVDVPEVCTVSQPDERPCESKQPSCRVAPTTHAVNLERIRQVRT